MTALCMRFRKIVTSGLSANAIRFATATSFGHRLTVNVSATTLSTIFKWKRVMNTSVPLGVLATATGSTSTGQEGRDLLRSLLDTALTSTIVDRDANTNGLDFGSVTLDGLAAKNSAVRATSGIASANDLVMAYVLFRCFGKTDYSDIGEIYNLQDAHNMVDTDTLCDAIADAVRNNTEEVESFLQEQLKNDLSRYITGTTVQAGLFDPNDATPETQDSTGGMVFVVGDVIEIPVRLVFRAPVSVASIPDDVLYASGFDQNTGVDKQVIKGEASTWDPTTTGAAAPSPGNVLAFRLQLTVNTI